MEDLGIKVRDDKEEGEGKLLVSVWQESFPTIKQVDYNEQIEYNKQIASYWNGLRIVPLTLAVLTIRLISPNFMESYPYSGTPNLNFEFCCVCARGRNYTNLKEIRFVQGV